MDLDLRHRKKARFSFLASYFVPKFNEEKDRASDVSPYSYIHRPSKHPDSEEINTAEVPVLNGAFGTINSKPENVL